MSRSAAQALNFLISPTLPPKILALTGALATVIIVVGVGIWGIIGACKAFKYLIHL